jgi:hypothetical protein
VNTDGRFEVHDITVRKCCAGSPAAVVGTGRLLLETLTRVATVKLLKGEPMNGPVCMLPLTGRLSSGNSSCATAAFDALRVGRCTYALNDAMPRGGR